MRPAHRKQTLQVSTQPDIGTNVRLRCADPIDVTCGNHWSTAADSSCIT